MALFPVHYGGSIGYYQALLGADSVAFETHENFVKQTHRNRMEILGPNGLQKLVIPTVKTGSKRPMNEVEISYAENWQKEHWKSLEAAYWSSPYFEFYEDRLRPFYTKKTRLLIDFNLKFIDIIKDFLKTRLNHSLTVSYTSDCSDDFRSESFDLLYKKHYTQVFSDRFDFMPNLSVLDLIFCEGPQAREFLLPNVD